MAPVADAQSEIDRLWDFDDPAGSEARFRQAADEAADASLALALRTQVARALGLQGRYEEAAALLDSIAGAAGLAGEIHVRLARRAA